MAMKPRRLAILALLAASAALAQEVPDSQQSAQRRMRAGATVVQPAADALPAAAVVDRPVAVLPTPLPLPPAAAPPSEGGSVRRGFDDEGRPYVEERLGDGSIRRQNSNGVTVIRPDGTQAQFRNSYATIDAPYATPPTLPSDPAQGRKWMSWHNDELLRLIQKLVKDDPEEMRRFAAAESAATGNDLFQQIEFRTNVLQELTKL
jgi:hypothetical protein